MNTYDLELLLEECRKELAGGRSLKDILTDHPAQAERLEPLLKAIIFTSSMSKPKAPEAAVLQGKNRLLSEVDDLRNEDHFFNFGTKGHNLRYSGKWLENLLHRQENNEMKLIPRLAIYLVVTVLIAGFFTVTASASSLPGDVLYGLKLNWEQVQKALASSEQTRIELEFEFDQERLSEVEILLFEGRIEAVEFSGQVEDMGEFSWVIGGIDVTVGPETELKDVIGIGDIVEVGAVTQDDGTLLALEISLDNHSDDDDLDDDSDDVDLDDDDDLDDDSDDVDLDDDDDLDDDSDDDDLDDDSDDVDLDDDDDLNHDSDDDDLNHDSDDDLDDDSDDFEQVGFSGQVEVMGEFTWVIDGIAVTIGPKTDLADDIEVGDSVNVEADTQEDGTLLALEISLDDLDDDSDDDLNDNSDHDDDGDDDTDDDDDEGDDDDD